VLDLCSGSIETASSLLQSFSWPQKYSFDKVLWPALCEVKWTYSEEGTFRIVSVKHKIPFNW